MKHSEEAREKMRLAKLGKPSGRKGMKFSDEWRKNISESHKGYVMPEAQKQKISASHKGKMPKNISMIAGWNKGKTASLETRKRIGDAHRGMSYSTKGKEKPYMRGEKNHNWKDTPTLHKKLGRKFLHGKLFYRAIAEDILGRSLRDEEMIHHINEDPADDRPENLYLFRTRAAHNKWHGYINRHNLPGTILESNLHLYSMKS